MLECRECFADFVLGTASLIRAPSPFLFFRFSELATLDVDVDVAEADAPEDDATAETCLHRLSHQYVIKNTMGAN